MREAELFLEKMLDFVQELEKFLGISVEFERFLMLEPGFPNPHPGIVMPIAG